MRWDTGNFGDFHVIFVASVLKFWTILRVDLPAENMEVSTTNEGAKDGHTEDQIPFTAGTKSCETEHFKGFPESQRYLDDVEVPYQDAQPFNGFCGLSNTLPKKPLAFRYD
jgi:hypothetical protein